MSLFQNLIHDSSVRFIASIVMGPTASSHQSEDAGMEISFQLDPAIQVESSDTSSDESTDVDLTDFMEMENANLDTLMDSNVTIDSDEENDISSSRLLVLCLQYLMDIEDFYLQYELPSNILDFLLADNNPHEEKHPVPENILNFFPVVKLDQKQLSENGECSICLEEFQCDGKALILSCNHYFHEACIKRWFQEQNFCPICKQEVC